MKLRKALILVLIEIPLGVVTPASCRALKSTVDVMSCAGSPATSSGRIISTPLKQNREMKRSERGRVRSGLFEEMQHIQRHVGKKGRRTGHRL
jgi:hypothetical protein